MRRTLPGGSGRDEESVIRLEIAGMFDSISSSLQKVFQKFGKERRLTEENMQEGLREIRTALLEADVNFKVARDLIKEVKARAVGEEVVKSVTPAQMIIKIFQDVLTEMMGPTASQVEFADRPPTVIMMAGLQGSGKTTTCGKLAKFLKKKGRNPLLVAADVQRPAAVEQLKVLGEQVGVPVFNRDGMSPPLICADAVSFASSQGKDVVILDTAGRLHIDEPLMAELSEIAKSTRPHQVYLVCDAMTGQDAVSSASEFNARLELDGVVLTKLDGDTRWRCGHLGEDRYRKAHQVRGYGREAGRPRGLPPRPDGFAHPGHGRRGEPRREGPGRHR